MKRAAIVTLNGEYNFGNRLQNYAVQRYIENLGFEVETISDYDRLYLLWRANKAARRFAHFLLKPTAFEKRRVKRLTPFWQRCEVIKGFSEQYIHQCPRKCYRKMRAGIKRRYDYFVVGSDQVWHCWRKDPCELDYFFLRFANPAQRITLAPSFGFEAFPEKFIKQYKKGLEGFEYLSVREERGAELIKELTGKDAAVLLDPTMLIDTSEWLKILKKPELFSAQDYILVYALGGLPDDVKADIRKVADDLHLSVVDISDEHGELYPRTRPDEFLYWIKSARLVVTNSFHASVFSILFGRPFMVAERLDIVGMENRLDTLLGRFGLLDRKYGTLKKALEDDPQYSELFSTHYECVADALDAERKKADEFIRRSFHLGPLSEDGEHE